jgi:hypothetical protein
MKNMISEGQEPTEYDLGGHRALPKKAGKNTKARGPAFSTYMVYFVRKLEWCHFSPCFCTCFTKKSFLAHRKWKMVFYIRKVGNSTWQHCLEYQNAPMCPIWAHYKNYVKDMAITFGHFA